MNDASRRLHDAVSPEQVLDEALQVTCPCGFCLLCRMAWLAAEVRRLRDEVVVKSTGWQFEAGKCAQLAQQLTEALAIAADRNRLAQQVSDLTEQLQSMIAQGQRDGGNS